MTLNDFINAWWDCGITYVVEAKYLDDVIDSIEAGQGIPKEYVGFCFDPGRSQWRCGTYLNEEWHKGDVKGFVLTDEGMCIFVEPYREDGEDK